MEISLLKVLLDNISSFFHLSSCVNINSEPVLKYYQRAEEILKLFKTILDAFIDSEAASSEVLKKSFEELGCFIDDLREQFVNWHPLSSKVYFVLQIESLLPKIRSSSLDIFQLLKSSHQVLPDQLDSVSLEAKRMPMVTQVHRGSFSQGSWIGEMQQASHYILQ